MATPTTPKPATAQAVASSALVRRALINIVMAQIKYDEQAPCSAAMHETQAITDLAAACPEWEPASELERDIIERARELTEAVRSPNDQAHRQPPAAKVERRKNV